MPYLSTFWKKHYKDVGFCCTYQPLEESPIMNIPGYENKYVVSFIDLEWMSSKQMKWIGWDKFGYIVWSTPQGMLYGFSDLKRNEAGKKFEKDHGKLPFVNPGVPFGKPIDDGGIKLIGADDSFYEKELRILKDCGFCHDHKPMPTHEEKDGKEKEADLPANTDAWKDYASGNLPTNTEQVTDYSVPTWSGVPPQEETPNYSSPAGGGAGGKDAAERDYMAPLPLAPLNNLPTDFTPTDLPAYIPTLPGQPTIPASKVVPSPATQQVAKMTLPSVIKPQAVNTKVTRNNSKQPSIPKIYGAPALPNSSNPPSVGTYGVTPTTMPQYEVHDKSKATKQSTISSHFNYSRQEYIYDIYKGLDYSKIQLNKLFQSIKNINLRILEFERKYGIFVFGKGVQQELELPKLKKNGKLLFKFNLNDYLSYLSDSLHLFTGKMPDFDAKGLDPEKLASLPNDINEIVTLIDTIKANHRLTEFPDILIEGSDSTGIRFIWNNIATGVFPSLTDEQKALVTDSVRKRFPISRADTGVLLRNFLNHVTPTQ